MKSEKLHQLFLYEKCSQVIYIQTNRLLRRSYLKKWNDTSHLQKLKDKQVSLFFKFKYLCVTYEEFHA